MASYLTKFSPPHHLIRIHGSKQKFTCDLCQTRGDGSHYRCQPCNFDLHDHCASQFRLPQTIKFFAHPWHDLSLQRGHGRFCDLCKEPAVDVFYRCIPCGFDVHPNCTTTKRKVHTSLDQHPLYLVPGVPKCNACNKLKGFWLYRCGICNYNLHIECLHAPPVSIPSGQSSNYQQILHGHGHGQANNTSIMPGMLQHSSSMPAAGTHQYHSSSSLGRLENILFHLGIHLGSDIAADVIANIIFNLLTNN